MALQGSYVYRGVVLSSVYVKVLGLECRRGDTYSDMYRCVSVSILYGVYGSRDAFFNNEKPLFIDVVDVLPEKLFDYFSEEVQKKDGYSGYVGAYLYLKDCLFEGFEDVDVQ